MLFFSKFCMLQNRRNFSSYCFQSQGAAPPCLHPLLMRCTRIFTNISAPVKIFKLFSDRRRFRTVYPFAAIPAGVTCLLTLVNLPCGIFFTVDSSNLYARSPLFFLPWAAVYGYMTAGALLACRCRRQVNKYLFMPVVFFLLPIYLGSLLQLLFYGIALI